MTDLESNYEIKKDCRRQLVLMSGFYTYMFTCTCLPAQTDRHTFMHTGTKDFEAALGKYFMEKKGLEIRKHQKRQLSVHRKEKGSSC